MYIQYMLKNQLHLGISWPWRAWKNPFRLAPNQSKGEVCSSKSLALIDVSSHMLHNIDDIKST